MFSKLFRKNNRTFELQNCYLRISVNEDWEEYIDEDKKNYGLPFTFYKKIGGVGALQISVLTSTEEKKFDIHETLKRNNQEHIKEIHEYNLNSFKVYEFEDVKDKRYTKFFNLIKPRVYVFATYNCDASMKNDSEIGEAVEMIRSIEIESK